MRKTVLKYGSSLEGLFKICASFYFVISFTFFFFFNEPGVGDESGFINDLLLIKTDGWIHAIEKSISIPYMILAYPLSLFFKEYLALRLVNLLLILLLFLYFFRIAKIKSTSFYFYLLFYIATTAVFFAGINDTLFFVGLIFFMTEVFYFIENKKMNSETIAFSGLVVSFFTREMFMVYAPVVLLGVYFLYKNSFQFFSKRMIFPVLLFSFFILVNIPSLQVNHKLSFDDKQPPAHMNVTWAQRQYLAQLMVNKGELQNFKHPSWEQTQEYLQKNGAKSLPKGTLDGLTLDYSLTVKEFFKDFYYSMFFGFRQLGLILGVLLYFILRNFKKRNFLNPEMYLPYATYLIISIFSLIIISYIELRWYTAVFIVSIVFYYQYQEQKKIAQEIILANYFILICFSLYGMRGLVPNLMSNF